MIFIQPEEGAANEEILHLNPSVVKNVALPIRVETLSGVIMLIEMSAVKETQTMLIRREM